MHRAPLKKWEGSFLHTSDAIEVEFVAQGCTIFFAFIGGGLPEKVFAVYLREFAVRLLLLWREIFAGG